MINKLCRATGPKELTTLKNSYDEIQDKYMIVDVCSRFKDVLLSFRTFPQNAEINIHYLNIRDKTRATLYLNIF